MALLFIVSLLIVGVLWLAVILYGRRTRGAAREADASAADRSVIEWQAGRWDKGNAGRLYVANVGDGNAHVVGLVASDRHDTVALKVDRVPPYHPADANAEADEGRQVEVQITWRSAQGRWSTQTLHTG
jgi:hypothetical protein